MLTAAMGLNGLSFFALVFRSSRSS